ncbi:hypothetical protein KKE19_04490 [Patescibacteria group bacterium]|nr:hypothetical protein [Patescibacteria group bacterium]MBU4367609.1 hypothetical protein [Patescibacteria group bacterium]MBU4462078.1 hypothetical protein [Patescibacteria group bacterium]MCG2700464.1 hypothetical protein [Candidatus Parcubacteria bacterium]
MKKKNITIDDLAIMVQKGFDKTSTKEQVEKLEYRIDKVEKSLEVIQNLIIEGHRKRIERLETEVKELKGLFAI